ncbi:MAG: hypothetical protein ACJAYN_001890 [Bermanella sp.]|jgi:hypothetical protein|nr:hypothetical protein [Glaciecola sp. 33A]
MIRIAVMYANMPEKYFEEVSDDINNVTNIKPTIQVSPSITC